MWLYFIENYHKESLQSRLINSSGCLPRKTQTDLRTRGLRLRSKELSEEMPAFVCACVRECICFVRQRGALHLLLEYQYMQLSCGFTDKQASSRLVKYGNQ